MKREVIFLVCFLAVSYMGEAYGYRPTGDYSGIGGTIGMLAPMGDFADGYDPSLVFGLALLTRTFELEVQYSSLGDEFAEEGRRYGYDIPKCGHVDIQRRVTLSCLPGVSS